jgi:hypothetical protein
MWDATTVLKNTHISDDFDTADWILDRNSPIMPKGVDASALDSNTNIDNNEHCDGEPHQVKQFDDEDDFRDIEFEDLVMSKGPQQILLLIL